MSLNVLLIHLASGMTCRWDVSGDVSTDIADDTEQPGKTSSEN